MSDNPPTQTQGRPVEERVHASELISSAQRPDRPGRVIFEDITFTVVHFGGVIYRQPQATNWPSQHQPAKKGFLIDELL